MGIKLNGTTITSNKLNGDQITSEKVNGTQVYPDLPTTYTVRFYDFQGTGNTLLKTETVASGGNATPPANPVRTGYQFTGWSPPYTNITTNTDIYGQWVSASTNYWAYIDETSGFIDDPTFANTTAYDYDNVITNATEAQGFLESIFPARNQNLTDFGLVYNQVIDYCWIFEVHS